MPSLVPVLVMAMQQGLVPTPGGGHSSPPSGDTVGYWQQRATYTITATLDETAQHVRARGSLRYVNNSPDTLREMYVHQYLNAFRPRSRWSEVDEREGRDRFQRLIEPDYGYERFTAPVRVNGSAAVVAYPGAPDSTVARFALPVPLAPRDSVLVEFEWLARPSTVPRRQGRRGRHWDLAQWYPKVAVYDRGGWQHNALQPAGEFYGEFGTYDVTLLVAPDQVIGATGVPVSGDPGWTRVLRAGSPRSAAAAYDSLPPSRSGGTPSGLRAVRFFARDVHHFAWSASPDYRYEGGVYARALPATRFPTWDTVSIHALWRPGDDTTWGGLRVVRRTISALRWLEALYGPYAYPQMTVLHRLDGGGTEFPMMQMNGSPSQGLILHEGGHVFTYGILANNEWRSGWLDEGLTSYQTAWAQLLTPQERERAGIVDRPVPASGYRARGIRMALPRFERLYLDQVERDLRDESQPIGTVAHEFRDFNTYNEMIYDRAEVMFGQLRDVLGDTVFGRFLRDYYARWALKHVDERAMRASAERVSGRDLGWFFDQWVHRTGVMDYSLENVKRARDTSGAWVTDATVRRRGEYRHPIRVGVRTASGWTFARAADEAERQVVRIVTRQEPLETRLDPFHVSWDWDRRNDARRRRIRNTFDWPLLVQADRERQLGLWRPTAWYSESGRASVGLRFRSNYLGWLDQAEIGVAALPQPRVDGLGWDRLQYWVRLENLTIAWPGIGWRMSAAQLDGVRKADIARTRVDSSARRSYVSELAVTISEVAEARLVPESWRVGRTLDLFARMRLQRGRTDHSHLFIEPRVLGGVFDSNGFFKLEASAGGVRFLGENARVALRGYGGVARDAPDQRALFLNIEDPLRTFDNHWWRPAGAILKREHVNWLPLGGAALRGFHWALPTERLIGGNVELSRRVMRSARSSNALELWANLFGDGGHTASNDWLSDAGVGLSLRGRLYDRHVVLRIDSPFFVSDPAIALDRGPSGRGQLARRWAISFNDIW